MGFYTSLVPSTIMSLLLLTCPSTRAQVGVTVTLCAESATTTRAVTSGSFSTLDPFRRLATNQISLASVSFRDSVSHSLFGNRVGATYDRFTTIAGGNVALITSSSTDFRAMTTVAVVNANIISGTTDTVVGSFIGGAVALNLPSGYAAGDPITGDIVIDMLPGIVVTGTPSRVTWTDSAGNNPNFFEVTAQAGVGGDLILCSSLSLGGANGDPHFLRWGHEHHDSFHGECDLVLMASKKEGIEIHISTTIRKFYSYIWKMAIGIGSHRLEIDKAQWTVDGTSIPRNGNTTYPMVVEGTNDYIITIAVIGEDEYKIQWGLASSIVVSITGIFLNVKVQAGGNELSDSVGLMGKFGTGDMLDRQGHPISSEDMVAYGMEWQVKYDRGDPKLFSLLEGPQWPDQQCVMPQWIDPKKKGRRLRGVVNHTLHAAAEEACQGAFDYDLCLEDVLVSGEIKLAKTFF